MTEERIPLSPAQLTELLKIVTGGMKNWQNANITLDLLLFVLRDLGYGESVDYANGIFVAFTED